MAAMAEGTDTLKRKRASAGSEAGPSSREEGETDQRSSDRGGHGEGNGKVVIDVEHVLGENGNGSTPRKLEGDGDAKPDAKIAQATVAGNPIVTGSLATGHWAQREAWLRRQEEEGDISFRIVKSGGENDLQQLEFLLQLKNIYSRQLPNMPREYIVRLVFDKHHRSMVAIKGNKGKQRAFGGCTFRCFEGQEFGEIVFLAIAAQEQVRGYGTRLMNHVKEYAKEHENLTHFLTYADNNAIGYFQKQGFTREIFLEREKWGGYIKDYDGGTLMECALNFQLSYTKFSQIIRKQREFLDSQVCKLSKSHVVYPGLKHFQDMQPGEYKAISIDSIPGLREGGYEPEASGSNQGASFQLVTPSGLIAPTLSSLHSFYAKVHASIVDHQDSWPFREAVDRAEVPDYYDVIKDPVDLSLIARRICSYEYYIQLEIFVADFKCMFNNVGRNHATLCQEGGLLLLAWLLHA